MVMLPCRNPAYAFPYPVLPFAVFAGQLVYCLPLIDVFVPNYVV
jgi:hypothetical protein